MEKANDLLTTADEKWFDSIPSRFWDYITSESLWTGVMQASLKIVGIIILAYIVVLIGKKIISNIFYLRLKSPLKHSERRQKTILKLLQSVLSYIIYFSAILAALSVLNINVAGLLAGAGIAGLAIGFGAQSLVKDIISGFFIIFEDQFGVGDYIQINNATGTVVEIGLRTTKIKGASGEQHIIPNGSIGTVVNYSVNDTSTYIDFDIPITNDLEKIEKQIEQFLKTLPEKYSELTSVPQLLGVQNFTQTDATMRIKIETVSMQHQKMARIIRKELLMLLEEFGVKMDVEDK